MTTIDRQAVLDSLSRVVTPGIKLTALADELGARKHEYAELRSIMFDLVEEGAVHVLTGGAFALAPSGRPAIRAASPRPRPSRGRPRRRARAQARRRRAPGRRVRRRRASPAVGAQARPARGAAAARAAPSATPAARPAAPGRPTARLPRARESTIPRPARPATVGAPAAAPAARGRSAARRRSRRARPADDRTIGRSPSTPPATASSRSSDGETVFVPAKYRGSSLDGDRVAVETWPGVRGTEGRVTEVLARGRARLTGILRRVSRACASSPTIRASPPTTARVGVEDASLGQDGDAVGRRDHALPRTPPAACSRACSRCSAIRTIRAPRSRRSSRAP